MDLVRSIVAALDPWRRRFWRSLPPLKASETRAEDPRHALGRRGEQLAARYLRARHGCKVLYRNFRAPHGGEVDIVCRDGDTLVFVEVKTRSSLEFGRPADAVNAEKRALITRGAFAWLRLLDNPDVLFRFDIVEVLVERGRLPRCRRLKGAFALPEPYIY